MLVLSRKLNETILIGNDIRITVVGIRGNQVRLGIDAPGHVKIFREELCAGDGSKPDPDAARQQPAAEESPTAMPGAAIARATSLT